MQFLIEFFRKHTANFQNPDFGGLLFCPIKGGKSYMLYYCSTLISSMVFSRFHSPSKPTLKGITLIPPIPPVGYLKVFLVFALFLLAGAGVLYWWAFPGFKSALLTKNWPSVEGRIIVSELKKVLDIKRNGIVFSYPYVEYEYHLEGERFIGKTISLWLAYSGNINESEKVLAFYPKGKTIHVYYNTKNPSESTLQPESLNGSLIVFSFSSLFTIIGLYGFSVTLRDFITGRPRPSIVIFEL